MEVEFMLTAHLNMALHSGTQRMSSGSVLVEGTHFHLTSLKILLMTFSVIDEDRVETEIEVVDPFSLPLVDSLPLGVAFLHLIQVLLRLALWDMEALLHSPPRRLVAVEWETSNLYQLQLK
ncbi:hypothetical protein lerEdw1_019153 [Lerista edwardsae]|nr:hypothetical protein lerEdw1_019153 [Lerista edwardsae]